MSAPPVVHAAWCERDRHEGDDDLDTQCCSEMRTFVTTGSAERDMDAIAVSVERRSYRSDGVGDWEPDPAVVVLETLRRGGSDLTPAEARVAARWLNEAADLAERCPG